MRKRVLIVLCLVGLLCLVGVLFIVPMTKERATNPFEWVDIPVPVRIDHELVAVPFYVSAKVKWYSEDLKSFKKRERDPCERAFANMLSAIKANKPNRISKRLGSDIGDANERKEFANTIIRLLGPYLDNPEICCQVYSRDERTFIFKCASKMGGISKDEYISMRFRQTDNGDFVWNGNMVSPLPVLVTDAMQYSKYDEARTGRVDLKYSSLPLEVSAKDNDEIGFKFDGTVVDFDVFSGKIDEETHPVVRFYAEAYRTLRDHSPEAFSEYYTSVSCERFRKWVLEMSTQEYTSFIRETTEPLRRVFFVLEADPVFIVFYTNRSDGVGSVRYEVVSKDAKSQFKLTSFYIFGQLDNVFEERDLFVDPILLPIVEKSENMP